MRRRARRTSLVWSTFLAAFLSTYYGNGRETSPGEPVPTVTGRDRIGLVAVVIDGQTYVVTDIAIWQSRR